MPASARLEQLYTGFAHPMAQPCEGVDQLVSLIVAEYARGLGGAFLDLHANGLEKYSRRLAETIANWLSGSDARAIGWDPCFGDAYRAMHSGTSHEHTSIAAAMAMHLGACGVPGDWEAQLAAPVRLRWGRLLLPRATLVRVQGDGDDALIATEHEGRQASHRLIRTAGQWTSEGVDSLMDVSQEGMCMRVLPRDALVLRDFDDEVARALPHIDPRMQAVFDDAVVIIQRYTPVYIPWIRRTLRYVFVLSPKSGTIESGSVEHYLGLIHVSAHSEPLPIAELLVHEAAHQHMNVLTKLGAIDDGSDTQEYYSPPVDKCRKLSLILAAYHAFGNVLLFYRLCEKSGLENVRECQRQERLLRSWLEQLERPLLGNPALTPIGRSLWQPLHEQLQRT